MRLAVADREFDKEHGEKETLFATNYGHGSSETGMPKEIEISTDHGLDRIEEKRQRLPETPRNQDQHRDHEKCDLNTAAHGNRHDWHGSLSEKAVRENGARRDMPLALLLTEIELALRRYDRRGRVFCGVADDRNDDQGDPLLRYI